MMIDRSCSYGKVEFIGFNCRCEKFTFSPSPMTQERRSVQFFCTESILFFLPTSFEINFVEVIRKVAHVLDNLTIVIFLCLMVTDAIFMVLICSHLEQIGKKLEPRFHKLRLLWSIWFWPLRFFLALYPPHQILQDRRTIK